MQVISKYQALDGKIFNTEKECLAYDKIVKQVKSIMKNLQDLPEDKDCRFANGKGFIKQDKTQVAIAKSKIYDLGLKVFKLKEKDVDFYFIGRYMNDSGYDCLYDAWGRLNNIDSKSREWGQGYYAKNPDKGVQAPYTEDLTKI